MKNIILKEEINQNLFDNILGRSSHSELDLQLIEYQKSNKHFNPFTKRFRYKVYNRETGRLTEITTTPRLTSKTTLNPLKSANLKFTPYPFNNYSPRKLVWWGKKNKIHFTNFFCKLFKSKFWLAISHVLKGVTILLIAHIIWGMYGAQILKFLKSIF